MESSSPARDTEWAMSEENVEVTWRVTRAWDEGVRDYFERVEEVFPERRLEPLEVIDVDDERVISVTRIVGRSEKFETELSADYAWLITFGTNRKAVRVEAFTDKAQVLEAAGLSE